MLCRSGVVYTDYYPYYLNNTSQYVAVAEFYEVYNIDVHFNFILIVNF
jgi:hypothetical protein